MLLSAAIRLGEGKVGADKLFAQSTSSKMGEKRVIFEAFSGSQHKMLVALDPPIFVLLIKKFHG